VQLSRQPAYEALSYTWGSDLEFGNCLTLNGTPKPLHENLEAALRRLRHSTYTRPLWVDAICINQSDIAEREQQIRIMRQIYLQANQVCVWLGENSDGSSLAMALLNTQYHRASELRLR
jgi:hypothetical protein